MKRRLNLTITPEVYDKAQAVMALLAYDSIVALVEHLIREEYERRKGPIKFPDGNAINATKPKSRKPKIS